MEMSAPFPLILTFSLREKEQQLHISTFAKRSEPLTGFMVRCAFHHHYLNY
jgi:hypothetical protein